MPRGRGCSGPPARGGRSGPGATVRDQTEAAYARSDLFERRRHLMDDWADYLKAPRGQVVALGW